MTINWTKWNIIPSEIYIHLYVYIFIKYISIYNIEIELLQKQIKYYIQIFIYKNMHVNMFHARTCSILDRIYAQSELMRKNNEILIKHFMNIVFNLTKNVQE